MHNTDCVIWSLCDRRENVDVLHWIYNVPDKLGHVELMNAHVHELDIELYVCNGFGRKTVIFD